MQTLGKVHRNINRTPIRSPFGDSPKPNIVQTSVETLHALMASTQTYRRTRADSDSIISSVSSALRADQPGSKSRWWAHCS
jgi:hypothetical protein